MVLQNQYSKLGHAFARVLKDKHGVTEFCAYIISPGARDFIAKQTDIRYDPVLVDHELHERYKMETADIPFIQYFEKTYGPPQLWHYLYTDRKLMMSMGPKEETTAVIDPLYSHTDLLRVFQVRAKAIEAMLKDAKPDIIFFFSIGALGHLLLYHVAKKLGIACYNIDFPRIENRMCISEDYRTLSFVEETFRAFQKEATDTPFHMEAKKLIEQFRATGSLRLQYMDIAVGHLPKKTSFFNLAHLAQSLAYLVTLSKNYLRNRKRFTYGITDENPLRFAGHKLRQYYRVWRGMNDLADPPNWQDEFVYVPLHYEPELSILLLSPFYFNQLELVRYIARSVPLHMKVYVKEHPAMVSKRARRYYKELKKIPNVVLVDPKTPGVELARRAKIIATITGTAGWEGALMGKPVITFGEVFYNALSFVKRVRNMETLPAVVRDALERFAYDEKEMTHFLAAVLKESVPFDFSRLWYENDQEKLIRDPGLLAYAELLMTYVAHRHSPADV